MPFPVELVGLADSIVLKIEAVGNVVICCQMCHTGNNVAKIPVWLASIDCVPNWVLLKGGLTPWGPAEEGLTLKSSSGGTDAVEVTVCVSRTAGAAIQGGAQV